MFPRRLPFPARVAILFAAVLTAAPAVAATDPLGTLPTVEEIMRSQTQPARPAAPAPRPDPLATLPTLGDIAARTQTPQSLSCVKPEPLAAMPDGKTATDVEMAAAQTSMKAFVTAGQQFQACLDAAQREAWGRLTVADFLTLESLYSQMQTLLEMEASRFNAQVRIYKARASAGK